MKRVINTSSLLALGAATAFAAARENQDSLRIEQLNEVSVHAVKAPKDAPFAQTNIDRRTLEAFGRTGQELPFLFAQTPGVLAWSENGMGTGTSYLRIRGAGDSRINVTLDGVPLNSPEDQCVFWANMNSYAALMGSVQIQRGVGTSTNGDGAFGGSIVLSTAAPNPSKSIELTGSYGSYNTFNVGGKFSSGLLGDHLIFDGAYHETNTDGYIHGTGGRSGSYYGGLTWQDDGVLIRYKNIGNFEKTGQAWNGVTAGNDDLSLMDGTYGMATGIHNYDDLRAVGLGKYNSLYEHFVYDENGDFARDAHGNYLTERYRMADGSLWDKTTDNFWQNHNILSGAFRLTDRWTLSTTAHYTRGYGYYKEFRYNNKLSKYGLSGFVDSEGNAIKRTDFVRKKGLDQNFYGVIANATYHDDLWDLTGGIALQEFQSNHFGYLTYIKAPELQDLLGEDGQYEYYNSDARKFERTWFVKGQHRLSAQWSAFFDVQYRYVDYQTDGINDKFYEEESGYYNQPLNIHEQYNFLNPKAGLSWHKYRHAAYASFALSHREPTRDNFTDNGGYGAPKSEALLDYEAGYQYTARTWSLGANLYFMDYDNQFVQTGAQSDIGEALTTNIKDSYRLGVELTASWDVTRWLNLSGNAALSQNKIKDFDEVVEDWDNGESYIHYDNSTLAFSPSVILNGFVTLHRKGWQAVWHTNHVSRQYLDNTENKDRSLPSYTVSNASISYTAALKSLRIREAVFGLNFNNIFDRYYASSGWVYSAICDSYGHPNDNRYYQIGYIPMAGFTMMGNVTLKF